jgi:hypothetical protein
VEALWTVVITHFQEEVAGHFATCIGKVRKDRAMQFLDPERSVEEREHFFKTLSQGEKDAFMNCITGEIFQDQHVAEKLGLGSEEAAGVSQEMEYLGDALEQGDIEFVSRETQSEKEWDSTKCQATTGLSTSVCSASCPGGFQVKDLCPGPSSVKCCVSKKQDVQLPGAYPSGDDQCAAQGGRCIDSKNPSNNEANSACGGKFKSRLCAGPDERRCCVGDFVNYPPESSMVEVRLRR